MAEGPAAPAVGASSRPSPGGAAPGPSSGVWTRAEAADGTALAFRLDGRATARPAVVLCNGIACSDEYWRPLVGPLSRDRLVLRWDYRGHGRSGTPARREAVGPEVVASDLVAVLDAAGLDDVVLVGHSYGVQVAATALPHLGARTRALAAVAGAGGQPLDAVGGPLPAGRLVPGLAGPAGYVPEATTALWRALWNSPLPYWSARLLGGASAAAPRAVMDDFTRHVAGLDPFVLADMMAAAEREDATDRLADCDAPVLALAGGRDRLTPVSRLRALAAAAPRGALTIHPRATHVLPTEAPEWVRRQIAPLLAEADRRPD